MNILVFCCGLIMLVVTSVLMIGRIKTHKAIDYEGHFIALVDNPLTFVMYTVFNFIFLLFISILMIVLSIVG
jgi:hypothetical protein